MLQLYISRGSIDSFSLISDAAYISASLARIMRALFEICLRRGWSEMSSFLLGYCKAIDRQIWPHQHPLRQFDKDLSPEVCLSFKLNVILFLIFGEPNLSRAIQIASNLDLCDYGPQNVSFIVCGC